MQKKKWKSNFPWYEMAIIRKSKAFIRHPRGLFFLPLRFWPFFFVICTPPSCMTLHGVGYYGIQFLFWFVYMQYIKKPYHTTSKGIAFQNHLTKLHGSMVLIHRIEIIRFLNIYVLLFHLNSYSEYKMAIISGVTSPHSK